MKGYKRLSKVDSSYVRWGQVALPEGFIIRWDARKNFSKKKESTDSPPGSIAFHPEVLEAFSVFVKHWDGNRPFTASDLVMFFGDKSMSEFHYLDVLRNSRALGKLIKRYGGEILGIEILDYRVRGVQAYRLVRPLD